MIYKRNDTYYYEFELRGRRYRESTRQGNPRVARQMEAARRTQILKGEVGIRERKPAMTLRQFADDCFKPHVESTFAAKFKTREYYLNSLKNLLAFQDLADKSLDEIKAESITAYAARRLDLGKETSTVNRELMVLRRMFNLAIEWGKTERILPKVRIMPGEKHRDRVVSRDEELRYLMAAPSLLRDVATILLDCGLRPEECFRLRVENIRDGAIHITYGKTKAARRRIPMTARVSTVVESRIAVNQNGWMFPAPTRSGHMESSSVKKQQARVFRVTGIRAFELYCLRHTCLTRWAPKMDPFTLAYLAGHSDISITKRYVHPEEETVKAAMDRVAAERLSPPNTPPSLLEGATMPSPAIAAIN